MQACMLESLMMEGMLKLHGLWASGRGPHMRFEFPPSFQDIIPSSACALDALTAFGMFKGGLLPQ